MIEGNGLVRWKPGRRADKRKRRFPPEILTDGEVRSLMDACGGYRPTALRNRALIALLYRGGLRISEALHLYPKDLDLEHGAVRVLFAKGGKYRTVGLDPGAVAVLQSWLGARSRWKLNGVHPLFCSQSGLPLTSGYVRQLLPGLGKRVGLLKRIHAHGFRHTHAAQLREEGLDIGIISKQLGHEHCDNCKVFGSHRAACSRNGHQSASVGFDFQRATSNSSRGSNALTE